MTRARFALIAAVALAAAFALLIIKPRGLRSDARPPAFKADVVVAGGSPAGVAAALAAARQGMVVVLVESRPFLGTVWTGAMLNMVDLSRRPDNRQPLIRGIFEEIYRHIGGITFDPRRLRAILLAKIEAEPGITLLLNTELLRPIMESGRVIGMDVRLPDGRSATIAATVVIDATDDGDLAAAAGVPFTSGRETSGIDRRTMPATLMFRLQGVEWSEIVRYAYAHRHLRQPSGAHLGYVWGFREVMRGYVSAEPGLSAHDLNVGRLPDETVLINSLQVHDVDGTDKASRLEAYQRARREVPNLVAYLREHAPGFAKVQLVEVAPELYIRETRHLAGLYTLTARDIGLQTRFWDRVAAASYPVDLHQYVKGEQYPYKPLRSPYTIPLRCLITAKIDGVFMASRAFSATYQAAGSARVIPTTMAMGEAVGVAAAVAVEYGLTPHRLAEDRPSIAEVQRRLVRAGALIDF
jgi:hypothetical protein